MENKWFSNCGAQIHCRPVEDNKGDKCCCVGFYFLKKNLGSIVCLFLLFKERKKLYVLGYEPFRQQRKHVSGNKIQRLFSTS